MACRKANFAVQKLIVPLSSLSADPHKSNSQVVTALVSPTSNGINTVATAVTTIEEPTVIVVRKKSVASSLGQQTVTSRRGSVSAVVVAAANRRKSLASTNESPSTTASRKSSTDSRALSPTTVIEQKATRVVLSVDRKRSAPHVEKLPASNGGNSPTRAQSANPGFNYMANLWLSLSLSPKPQNSPLPLLPSQSTIHLPPFCFSSFLYKSAPFPKWVFPWTYQISNLSVIRFCFCFCFSTESLSNAPLFSLFPRSPFCSLSLN